MSSSSSLHLAGPRASVKPGTSSLSPSRASIFVKSGADTASLGKATVSAGRRAFSKGRGSTLGDDVAGAATQSRSPSPKEAAIRKVKTSRAQQFEGASMTEEEDDAGSLASADLGPAQLAAKRLWQSLSESGDGWVLPTTSDCVNGVWKPVVVRFLNCAIDRAIAQIREDAGKGAGQKSKAGAGSTLGAQQSASPEASSPAAAGVLQDLRGALSAAGGGLAEVAGMVSAHTFALNSARLGELVGPHVPRVVRRVILRGILLGVQKAWDRFNSLLMGRCGCLERAFQWLDKDMNGFMSANEFTYAFTELNMTMLEEQQSMQEKGMTKELRRAAAQADAEFLFQALQVEVSTLSLEDSRRVQVSRPHLIMRIMSVSDRCLEKLRNRALERWPDYLHSAVETYGRQQKGLLHLEEFQTLFRELTQAPDAEDVGRRSSSEADRGFLRDRPVRIFQGADLSGKGFVTVPDLEKVMGEVVPPVPFSTLRKRMLLRYGDFEAFFAKHPNLFKTDEEVDAFASLFDLRPAHEGSAFAKRLGLLSKAMEDSVVSKERKSLLYLSPRASGPVEVPKTPSHRRQGPVKVVKITGMPEEGYTLEEFAIAIFLCKPEKASLEDLAKEMSAFERERHVSFEEFAENIVTLSDPGAKQPRSRGSPSQASANRLKRVSQNKLDAKGLAFLFSARTRKPPAIHVSRTLCSVDQLRCVYKALEREHNRVSVDALLTSARRVVSDCIALDKSVYQAGERIACRIRLSQDMQRQCNLYPFLAVVPRHLERHDDNIGRSFYMLEGRVVTKFWEFSESYHMLPISPQGKGVLPEAFLWITAPMVSSNVSSYEVRIFASRRADGGEALNPVGQAVPIEVMLPRPQPPKVETMFLQNEEEGYAQLRWSAPHGNFESAPIVGFMLKVEPVVFPQEIPVSLTSHIGGGEDSVGVSDFHAEDSGDESADEGIDANKPYKEIVVWSPDNFDFSKQVCARVDGLKRGTEYRFGVQCMHAALSGDRLADAAEVRGAPSELSEVVKMPLFRHLPQPGKPRGAWNDKSLRLRWKLFFDPDLDDDPRLARFKLEYRQVAVQGSDGEEETDAPSDDDDSSADSDASGGAQSEGEWQAIDDATSPVFTTAPAEEDYGRCEVRCQVEDPMQLRGVRHGCWYQYRVCAVNFAGDSQWSAPSRAVKVGSASQPSFSKGAIDRLEVVECQGTYTAAGGHFSRSQCLLRFRIPREVVDAGPRYYFQVADLVDPQWMKVKSYILDTGTRKSMSEHGDSIQVEALVTNLEKFSPTATLTVQVLVLTDGMEMKAEVEVLPTDPAPPPLPGAPRVVQMLQQEDAKVTLQLQWDAAVDSEKRAIAEASRYLVQVARAQRGYSEAALRWTSFSNCTNAYMGTEQGSMSCFLRGLETGNTYCFRVCSVALDGRLGEPSDASSPLSLVGLQQAGATVRSALLGDAGRLRTPRDIQVSRAGEGWCEVAWEQQVPKGAQVPPAYEVQRCCEETFGEAAEAWSSAKSVYPVTVQTWSVTEKEDCQRVRAAVFFPPEGSAQEPSAARARWRLRVCIAGGSAEWSTPSSWQPPTALRPTRQPGTPELVRNTLQYHCLEWAEAEDTEKLGDRKPEAASYELQVQVNVRHRWITSAWFPVPTCSGAAKDGGEEAAGSERVVRGLVERTAIADAMAKAANPVPTTGSLAPLSSRSASPGKGHTRSPSKTPGSASSLMRFRVRAAADSAIGVLEGASSEWSRPAAGAVALAPVAAPAALRVAGLGRLFMEDAAGQAREPELLQLEWALPETTGGGDAEGAAEEGALFPVTDEVQKADPAEEAWLRVPGVLVHVDRLSRLASALVLLPGDVGEQQARFRVVAVRATAAASGPFADQAQDAQAVAHSEETDVLSWGRPLFEAREAAPSLEWAEPSLLSVAFTLGHGVTASVKCSVWAILEVNTGGAEDDDGAPAFVFVGSYPVFWNPSGQQEEKLHGDCRGVVALPSEARRSPGERVRVRLCASPFKFHRDAEEVDGEEAPPCSEHSAEVRVLPPFAGAAMARRLSVVSMGRARRSSVAAGLQAGGAEAAAELEDIPAVPSECSSEDSEADQDPYEPTSAHTKSAVASAAALDGEAAEQADQLLRRPSLLPLCAVLCALAAAEDSGLPALDGAQRLLRLPQETLALVAEVAEARLETIIRRGAEGKSAGGDSDGSEGALESEESGAEPEPEESHPQEPSMGRMGSVLSPRHLRASESASSLRKPRHGSDTSTPTHNMAEPLAALPSSVPSEDELHSLAATPTAQPSTSAADRVGKRVSIARGSMGQAAVPGVVQVDLSYPSPPSRWPSFVELEFVPDIRFRLPRPPSSRRRSSQAAFSMGRMSSDVVHEDSTGRAGTPVSPRASLRFWKVAQSQSEELLGMLRFSVEPALPTGVHLDASSGTIRGTPMLTYVDHAVYVVSAVWQVNGEEAARRPISFDVAPLDTFIPLQQPSPASPPAVARHSSIISRQPTPWKYVERATQTPDWPRLPTICGATYNVSTSGVRLSEEQPIPSRRRANLATGGVWLGDNQANLSDWPALRSFASGPWSDSPPWRQRASSHSGPGSLPASPARRHAVQPLGAPIRSRLGPFHEDGSALKHLEHVAQPLGGKQDVERGGFYPHVSFEKALPVTKPAVPGPWPLSART